MSTDVLIHLQEPLDERARQDLLERVRQRLGVAAMPVHHSCKPHLLFFPTDAVSAPPHQVVQAVRELGHRARLVDL